MIRDRVVASRYGEAFFQYCLDTIGQDKAISDLKKVKEIMRESPALKEFFQSLEIPLADKYGIIDKVFGDELSNEVRHLLKLLIEHKRLAHFSDIAEYIRIKYAHQGRQEVLLKTSYPLDLDLVQRIEEELQRKFNQRFKFYIELDSRLLGGVQVIMGNTIIDGSLRGRLNNLKERLKSLQVN